MATTTFQPNYQLFTGIDRLRRRLHGRGLWFGLILLAALVAFELFNFATTEFALDSLFGDREALGVATWATVLAIAFCGIDFAGLSRLFTPETGRKEPKEIWLLTGAWFLGAGMNALMTWWAVGSALSANPGLGNEILNRADILHYGPIFIALLVWLTRILIIGTFAFAGDHIFTTAEKEAGKVVEGRARPVFGGRRQSPQGREVARTVPGPGSASALPDHSEVRSAAVESSSYYARAADYPDTRRSYDSQRGFFGQGAGRGYQSPAAPRREEALSQSSLPERPATPLETPRRSYTPTIRDSRPAAYQASPSNANGRASTTRTIGTPGNGSASRSANAAPRPSATPDSIPAQMSMELEYVNLE